jgi:hypothetical protein
MSQELWTTVDRYITDLFVPADPALYALLEGSDAAGLPQISVSATEGKPVSISTPPRINNSGVSAISKGLRAVVSLQALAR